MNNNFDSWIRQVTLELPIPTTHNAGSAIDFNNQSVLSVGDALNIRDEKYAVLISDHINLFQILPTSGEDIELPIMG